MKLYSNRLSPNCRKVHTVIGHTGIEVEEIAISLGEGEQKQTDFLAINPNGKVPALIDGDTKLWESDAIACYLASKAKSDLWPASNQRYDILRWMFWSANHFSNPVGSIIGQKIFNRDNPDQAIIDKGLADFRHVAGILDRHLHGRSFLSGDGATVADISVGVWLGYATPLELPLGDFAEVSRWFDSLVALKGGNELLPPG